MRKNNKVENKSKTEEKPSFAKLDRIYKDKDWKNFKNKPVIPLGADTPTNNLVGNLDNYFNLLVGGKKGSGKSTLLHCGIVNLLRNTKPGKVRFILIDAKRKDFIVYDNLPILLFPIITKYEKAITALRWCCSELDRRVEMSSAHKKHDKFDDPVNKMPRIVIVINELSELAKIRPKYFNKVIGGISKYGPLVHMHLLASISEISNKLLSEKVIGSFHRVAFATNSGEASKILIGGRGAEKLKGRGDAILKFPDKEKENIHFQGFFISQKEIRKTVAAF